MEIVKELIIFLIFCLFLSSPFLILLSMFINCLNKITPCKVEENIEDILNNYNCLDPLKRRIIKNKLIYGYRYNNLKTHKDLVKRFKKLEKKLMEEK